jgi:hypothetical protein
MATKPTSKRSTRRRHAPPTEREAAVAPGDAEAPRKLTTMLPARTIAKLHAACFWEGVTLATFVHDAVNAEISRREKARGEPFAVPKAAPRPGRPIGR